MNNNNLEYYINSYINWITNISISSQYNSFIKGFMKISLSKLFLLFSPDELDILVSGEIIFDWNALKQNAKYIDGYNEKSIQIIWFWEIFNNFNLENKKKFLRFSTGNDKAPVGGLGEVILTIQKTQNINMLPVSHTCFNIFSLPSYKTKDIMKQKILLAIQHFEGFGLV